MNKVQITTSRLFAILLVPGTVLAQNIDTGVSNQTQTEELDDILQDYTLQEINHAFRVMEPFVIYEENKNIEFDTSAIKDPKITQKDIDVALDFAIHNNAIMNATVGSVGKVNELGTSNVELERALQEFQSGKFKALFTNFAIGSTNDITPAYYDYLQTPIVTVFGIDSIVPIHHGAPDTACGGGFNDPHTSPPIVASIDYTSLVKVKSLLVSNGYHVVALYATFSYGMDYAKGTTYHGCSNNEMRSQAFIYKGENGYYYNSQSPEPNPEVLIYSWPAYWWGPYVALWHAKY